jgi:hypothetical protein
MDPITRLYPPLAESITLCPGCEPVRDIPLRRVRYGGALIVWDFCGNCRIDARRLFDGMELKLSICGQCNRPMGPTIDGSGVDMEICRGCQRQNVLMLEHRPKDCPRCEKGFIDYPDEYCLSCLREIAGAKGLVAW